MNDATVEGFRMLAKAMNGDTPTDWQWNGEHLSQQMYGITRERAEDYAEKHGGTAKQMVSREGGKFLSEAQ